MTDTCASQRTDNS